MIYKLLTLCLICFGQLVTVSAQSNNGHRDQNINPAPGSYSIGWEASDLLKMNSRSTITPSFEYWSTSTKTYRVFVGIPPLGLSNFWTFPSAIKDQHVHFLMGGEIRKYSRYYANFLGFKFSMNPQFYSRDFDLLSANDHYFQYTSTKVRDFTTSGSLVLGIRPKISNQVYTDVKIELGIAYRYIRHYDYEGIERGSPPSIEGSLPNFISDILYDSSSKRDGGNVMLTAKVGFSIGYINN